MFLVPFMIDKKNVTGYEKYKISSFVLTYEILIDLSNHAVNEVTC